MARVVAPAVPQTRRVSLIGRIVGASSPLQTRDALLGYLFLLPWLIGLIVFFLGPILISFALSFTKYDVITSPAVRRPEELPDRVLRG